MKLKCASVSVCHVELKKAYFESEFEYDSPDGKEFVTYKVRGQVIGREECGKLVEISKKPQFF
jgi:hypothetical protein